MSLDWPGKTVRLERESLHEHWQRPVSGRPAIAELYHENSKLFDAVVEEMTASRTDMDGLRRAVAQQRSNALKRQAWPILNLPSVLQTCLLDALDGLETVLFALEVRVLVESDLAIFDHEQNEAYAIKRLEQGDVAGIAAALALMGNAPRQRTDSALVFVVANFARNQILFGPRGYRRTLFEAGQVCQRLLDKTIGSGWQHQQWLEFADRQIDAVMEADGVEEGIVAVLEVTWGAHVDHS